MHVRLSNERALAPLHSLLPVLLKGLAVPTTLGRRAFQRRPCGAPAAPVTRETEQVRCTLSLSCPVIFFLVFITLFVSHQCV